MVDAEVLRLRKLRNVALRARALGKCLDSYASEDGSVYARGAVISWTIGRIATGRLRAHPYLRYQKDRGEFAQLLDDATAAAAAALAQRQKRSDGVYAEQLLSLAQQVADVRALTLSPDLSDSLGRVQIQLRRLMGELQSNLPVRQAAALRPRVQALSAATRGSLDGMAVETSWPYLAI
jgi:hypothetical protein